MSKFYLVVMREIVEKKESMWPAQILGSVEKFVSPSVHFIGDQMINILLTVG